MIFTDASTQCWGAHMGDSNISGTMTHAERKLHFFDLELKAVILALHHWVTVLRATKLWSLQGRTYSHKLLPLVVGLFLWLQTQDIAIMTRQILGCLTVKVDRLSQSN